MSKLKNTLHLCFGFLIFASWILSAVYGDENRRNYPRKQAFPERSMVFGDDASTESSFLALKAVSSYARKLWMVNDEYETGWRIVVGTIIGFCGAALGSAGGIGAGGIFIPMLTLVIGFDAKSSTAISKCMILGLSAATICYNIKQRHPIEVNKPLIDYDLALLVQPMLILGISTGVTLNVIFANWMVTVLLIIVFLATSTRSLYKGVKMWKQETALLSRQDESVAERRPLLQVQNVPVPPSVSLSENVRWKQLSILFAVWLSFLAIQIFKGFTTTCSTAYWVLYLLQIPVAFGTTFYQALRLKRKSREVDSSKEEVAAGSLTVLQHITRSSVALLAGIIGGLLGLGGGFLLSPLFLEIGVIPQVSSATATFVMAFSASMCAIEYYLLNRFPLLHALYFAFIAIVASLVGQHYVKDWIAKAGRPSLIVFILSSVILISALLLGGQGIANMIYQIKHHEYMGFEPICKVIPNWTGLTWRLV